MVDALHFVPQFQAYEIEVVLQEEHELINRREKPYENLDPVEVATSNTVIQYFKDVQWTIVTVGRFTYLSIYDI